VLPGWHQDLESLEAISQDDDARRIFLRMAAMSHAGRLPNFIAEVAHDRELARKVVKKGLSVRATERAARWAGARQKPRKQPATLDPALIARAKSAAGRITGFPARVAGGRLEIQFGDEAGLEELVEALEGAAP
jgi:ParB-like chromosome segregation protein Spo0J